MTTPVGGVGPGPITPAGVAGIEGARPAGAAAPSGLGPALVDDLGAGAVGAPASGDLAMLVELLQAECSRASSDNEKQAAKSEAAAKKEQVQRKLAAIAEALEKQQEAARNGRIMEGLKWAGVAIAAIAGAVGSIFSFGAAGAAAGAIISAILTVETVVKTVTEKLVEQGKLGENDAQIICACFGSTEDLVAACIDEDRLGDDGRVALMCVGLADQVAKAVVSCVFSGGSNVTQAIQGVTKILAAGAETVVEAQQMVAEAIEEGRRDGKVSEEALLAMQLVATLLELCSAAAGFAGGGTGGEGADVRQVLDAVGGGTKGLLDGGAAGAKVAQDLAAADAFEARARSERHEALSEVAAERLRQAVAQLQEILDQLEEARDDVDALLEADCERARLAAGPARV